MTSDPYQRLSLAWTWIQPLPAFSLAVVLSGFAAIPVVRWLDRHGARLLM